MNAKTMADKAWQLRENMMRVAMSILHQAPDAEDAVSEAILKACRSADRLREERYLKTWLMQILVRCCYDLLRKRKREILEEDFSAYDQPALECEEGSVFELIQGFPLHYRQVLILHYYEGFKAKEIARVLSVPVSTVLVRMSRGRNKLRALIEKEEMHYAQQTI